MAEKICFADVRRILEDLGFRKIVHPSAPLAFEHSASGTLFLIRPYQAGDRVMQAHLAMVRRILDERNLLSADAFENLLRKAPA